MGITLIIVLLFGMIASVGIRTLSEARIDFAHSRNLIVVSLILLIVTAPIVALAALAVKLETKGPAFFRQRRVGIYGEPFELIKIR